MLNQFPFQLLQRVGLKAKWVVSLLLTLIIFIPSVWLAVLDWRTNERLMAEVERTMRNDAVLFAERLIQYTEYLLYEQGLNPALGQKSLRPEELAQPQQVQASRLIEYPFAVNLGDTTVMKGTGKGQYAGLEQVLAQAHPTPGLTEDVYMRGYVEGPEGPAHFVYTFDAHDEGAVTMRGVKVNPVVVQQSIIPQAFVMLSEAMAAQRGAGMFPGGIISMEITAPDTTLRLSGMAPELARETGAIDTYTRSFDLGGLFPEWTIQVACYNKLKANAWQRYLATLFPLLVLLVGGVYTSRMVMKEVELSEAKSTFVSNVSHELKMPLAKIQFFNELLQRLPGDALEKHQRYHGAIDQECERLSILVDNVLDFNRIERGQMSYNFVDVDVKDVVTEVVETFNVLYAARGYGVDCELEEPLPMAHMDPATIRQALINLMDNAVKYSDPHTIHVRAFNTRLHGAPAIGFSVKDQGIGIAQDKLGLIFTEFYRIESGFSQRVSGSGLGLALVRHIVNAHHGTIEVESELDRGSTFTIVVPV
jgi:signal transduction histidine kinase